MEYVQQKYERLAIKGSFRKQRFSGFLRYVSQTSVQKQKVANALNGVLKVALETKGFSGSERSQAALESGPYPQCPANLDRKNFRLIKSVV